ncbi:hypothetical protein CD149_11300 [Staphylococcus condimenti]|uniref:Uncharacterized protein n=2 Tax=Staphylococcus condimenti TaxID=70255 RepID=A0A143PCQ4_9STAP|nr:MULTISPECIES: hypothetical protein [Staphylococcus]AMY05858.1 hypothetical protein A4G25_07955 [Staphylococcus condimenti]APR59725.1 hypothetical protein BTZ13_00235 [Staphylococcus condimenti]MDK8644843.1 hypothetical protein [Staphylococcus condimenti]OFP01908.1 hypothetical protein HMPREF3007_03980 [Staphylococcus sp. HMSC065E08]PNZ57858.1 hypothetical protein CD149_11300 [Staphylococcus condimenti]
MLNLRLNADIVEWYMRYLYMCEEVPFDMTLDIIKDYSEKEIDENNNLVLKFRGIKEEEEVFKSLIKKLVIKYLYDPENEESVENGIYEILETFKLYEWPNEITLTENTIDKNVLYNELYEALKETLIDEIVPYDEDDIIEPTEDALNMVLESLNKYIQKKQILRRELSNDIYNAFYKDYYDAQKKEYLTDAYNIRTGVEEPADRLRHVVMDVIDKHLDLRMDSPEYKNPVFVPPENL